MDQSHSRERSRSTILAFAAAYADTCGVIGVFGLFTAHVTGNPLAERRYANPA